jgi:hypothetical protein
MRQIIYAMQFNGEVKPVGTSPNVMKATMSAASCRFVTVIGSHGIEASWQPLSRR